MSCAGNGYLTGNTLIPFPFEDETSGAEQLGDWSEEWMSRVFGCFADAGIFAKAGRFNDGEWPSIGGISCEGGNLSFTLSCCGSSKTMSVAPASEKFPVVSGNETWGSYFIVLSADGIRSLDDFTSSPLAAGCSSPVQPEGDLSFRLCAKCVTLRPESMTSLRVFDGVSSRGSGPHFVLSGDVSFKPGNNMVVSADGEENAVTLSAVPGAGMGAVNCGCGGSGKSDSSIFSPDGNTRIINDTCYDFEPAEEGTVVVDGVERRSRKLRIHGKCTACCTCDMYASIVNDRLAALFRAVKKAKDDIGGLLSTYEDGVEAFNRRMKVPTIADVTLSISGAPSGRNLSPKLSGGNVKGNMERCAFTAVLRNASYFKVKATIGSMWGTDNVVEASVSWSDETGRQLTKNGDSANAIIGSAFTVLPGRSLVVSFVSAKASMVSSVTTGGFTGHISVGLSTPEGSLGTLSKSVSV